MKTVSTKINSRLYEYLINTCNGSGCSVSEKLRELIENESKHSSSVDVIQHSNDNGELQSNGNSKNKDFDSHYDSHGHYYTYDENRKRWTCHLNPKNIRITS